jgi:hypothetical protein
VGELASRLVEEIAFHVGRDLARSVSASQDTYREEVATLRAEVRDLRKKIDTISRTRRVKGGRSKLGRWVPGGPGRPPKDAAERIAAFSAKHPRGRKPRDPV